MPKLRPGRRVIAVAPAVIDLDLQIAAFHPRYGSSTPDTQIVDQFNTITTVEHREISTEFQHQSADIGCRSFGLEYLNILRTVSQRSHSGVVQPNTDVLGCILYPERQIKAAGNGCKKINQGIDTGTTHRWRLHHDPCNTGAVSVIDRTSLPFKRVFGHSHRDRHTITNILNSPFDELTLFVGRQLVTFRGQSTHCKPMCTGGYARTNLSAVCIPVEAVIGSKERIKHWVDAVKRLAHVI